MMRRIPDMRSQSLRQLFDYPAAKLHMVGITGTKGRQRRHICFLPFFVSGHKTGMIGTIAIDTGDGRSSGGTY